MAARKVNLRKEPLRLQQAEALSIILIFVFLRRNRQHVRLHGWSRIVRRWWWRWRCWVTNKALPDAHSLRRAREYTLHTNWREYLSAHRHTYACVCNAYRRACIFRRTRYNCCLQLSHKFVKISISTNVCNLPLNTLHQMASTNTHTHSSILTCSCNNIVQ